MSLLHGIKSLRDLHPSLSIEVFHYNFGIRAKAADEDEILVRQVCEHWGFKIFVERAKTPPQSQVEARELRLKATKKKSPEACLIEAHHLGDQVETILFRLFRGTGLHGLRGIEPVSKRRGRTVLRPLLKISKAELRDYAESQQICFREDASNFKTDYDRNWIRQDLLPQIKNRFAGVERVISGLSDEVGLLQASWQKALESWEKDAVESTDPLILKSDKLKELSPDFRNRVIHYFFQRRLGVFLSRSQVVELGEKLGAEEAFSFNLPRGIVLRRQRGQNLEFFEGPRASRRMQVTNAESTLLY